MSYFVASSEKHCLYYVHARRVTTHCMRPSYQYIKQGSRCHVTVSITFCAYHTMLSTQRFQ